MISKLNPYFFILLLTACSHEASHLPSILELPGAVIGSAIDNTVYNNKRKKVESYVAEHYLALRKDVAQQSGETLEGALNRAGLKGEPRLQAKQDLINNQALYFYNPEPVVDNLIYPFAALYTATSSEKDKRINGFTLLEARETIHRFAKQHFEALRQAIAQGSGTALGALSSELHIQTSTQRQAFYAKAQSRYTAIYLDPIVVVLMVHSD